MNAFSEGEGMIFNAFALALLVTALIGCANTETFFPPVSSSLPEPRPTWSIG
jgi:hypothetical protein